LYNNSNVAWKTENFIQQPVACLLPVSVPFLHSKTEHKQWKKESIVRSDTNESELSVRLNSSLM
jgi:hypothetical protein